MENNLTLKDPGPDKTCEVDRAKEHEEVVRTLDAQLAQLNVFRRRVCHTTGLNKPTIIIRVQEERIH